MVRLPKGRRENNRHHLGTESTLAHDEDWDTVCAADAGSVHRLRGR